MSGTGCSRLRRRDFRGCARSRSDQDFPFVLVQAGQQAAFAFERGDDHLVMGYAPFAVSEIAWLRPSSGAVRSRPGRVFATPPACGSPGPCRSRMTWQIREGGMPGLDRQQRHDPPFP